MVVYFQTKNPDLGHYLRALKWKRLVCLMAIRKILQTFGIFYGNFANLGAVWYISPILVYCVKKNLATLIAVNAAKRPQVVRLFLIEKRESDG
jgi:hypothetical protein